LLNLYKGARRENVTIGPVFGLRPGNYADIMEGARLHKERAFENMPEPQEADIEGDDFRNDGYASSAFPGAQSSNAGSSAEALALSHFLNMSPNALNSLSPINAPRPELFR
jgi:hypothetical protein